MKWMGVLFYIDEPGHKPANGSRGHLIKFTRAAAEDVAREIVGGWISEEHVRHAGFKIFGRVTEAVIVDDALVLAGEAENPSSPDINTQIAAAGVDIGMSIEAHQCHIRDQRAAVWEIWHIGSVEGARIGTNSAMRSGFWWLDDTERKVGD